MPRRTDGQKTKGNVDRLRAAWTGGQRQGGTDGQMKGWINEHKETNIKGVGHVDCNLISVPSSTTINRKEVNLQSTDFPLSFPGQ